MAGDAHGTETQEEPQTTQEPEQAQEGLLQLSGMDWQAAIAERDSKIASLEAQIAEAAKNAETAESLRSEIAALKAQGENDRIDFKLQLAGCRNVKAARAILSDHDNDVDKLKAAEPWLFAKHAAGEGTGTTGLPNAGAATDEGKQLKHWREIAGLEDESDKK